MIPDWHDPLIIIAVFAYALLVLWCIPRSSTQCGPDPEERS